MAKNFFIRKIFTISAKETLFEIRGFEGGTPDTRLKIEEIGSTFVKGYHAALEETQAEPLAKKLDKVGLEQRGFAYEGAAMALTIQDFLTPWKDSRLADFLKGPGDAHTYMVHVGVGWALARLPQRVEPNLGRFDPLLRWLILDGYGFHQGYFHWPEYIAKQKIPRQLSAYGRRIFDQGLGRSLWFVKGADAPLITNTLNSFSKERQSDLWCGIGLAATYAGSVPEADLLILRKLAGIYQPQLAQGAAFAAKARQRAGNPADHTERASHHFCRLSADEAAAVTDDALKNLPGGRFDVSAYEIWRCAIQEHFTETP